MMKCCIMAMLQQKFEAVFPEEIYFDGLKTPGRKASGGDIRMSFAPSGDPSLDAAFFGGCGLAALLGESMVELGLGVVCQPAVGQHLFCSS